MIYHRDGWQLSPPLLCGANTAGYSLRFTYSDSALCIIEYLAMTFEPISITLMVWYDNCLFDINKRHSEKL